MLLFNKRKYLLALLFGVFIANCAFEPAWIAKDDKPNILWQKVELNKPKTDNDFHLTRHLASRIGETKDTELFLNYELYFNVDLLPTSASGHHGKRRGRCLLASRRASS